jgi:hypothetical protein
MPQGQAFLLAATDAFRMFLIKQRIGILAKTKGLLLTAAFRLAGTFVLSINPQSNAR